MSIGNRLLSDLARMYPDAPPQLGARVSHDADLLAEQAFRDKHGGMTRAEFAEQQRRLARERFEQQAVADIESALDAISGGTARQRYTDFHALLSRERDTLAAFERKRAELLGLVDAPAKTKSKIQQAIAATKAFLLGGGDEPAIDRQALDAELSAATHKAQAASEAIDEIDSQIEIARLRCNRLEDAGRELLRLAMREVVQESGLLQVLAKKRAETAALERLLNLPEDLVGFGGLAVEPQRHEIKWKHSWREIAEAIKADPSADVAKMMPKVSS